MGTPYWFDVDEFGNIYFLAIRSDEHFVYKVSEQGELLHSFGRIGQGPGELELAFGVVVLGNGNIAITDRNKKIAVFDGSGRLLNEIKFQSGFALAIPLKSGGFLLQRSSYGLAKHITRELVLLDDEKREVKILDTINLIREDTLNNRRLLPYFVWEATADRIFSMSEDRGYEVLVYDHEGHLVNKIKGKPRRIKATEEIKRAVLGPTYGQPGTEKYFPDPLPPVNHFFTDDEGRVFVMTYEKDPKNGFHVYDIYNSEGTYLGSQGIQTIWAQRYFANLWIVARKNKLYGYREDQEGYLEFIIQRIVWNKF